MKGTAPRGAQVASRLGSRLLIGMLLIAGLGLTGAPASAQTTAETGVSVVVTNGGSLDIHWKSDDVTFLMDGANPGPTATEPASATTTLLLVVHDTRADAERSGYAVALSTSGFSTSGADAFIDPAFLLVIDIAGLPDETSAQYLIGATLASPVTILSVASGAPAVDTVIAITIRMVIPAGTVPGAYDGGFSADIIPAAADV